MSALFSKVLHLGQCEHSCGRSQSPPSNHRPRADIKYFTLNHYQMNWCTFWKETKAVKPIGILNVVLNDHCNHNFDFSFHVNHYGLNVSSHSMDVMSNQVKWPWPRITQKFLCDYVHITLAQTVADTLLLLLSFFPFFLRFVLLCV